MQSYFSDKLEELMTAFKEQTKNLNLVLIGSSTTEKLYNYFYHHKGIKNKTVIDKIKNEKDCINTLLEMISNFRMVYSNNAAVGKTQFILRKCQEFKLKPCFFLISGGITEEKVAERLNSTKFDEDLGLIIQLHNVVDKEMLDEILFQLIFFRSLKCEELIFCTEKKFHLFIEIQNILDEKYLDSLRTLAALKFTKVVEFIEDAKAENICVSSDNELEFHFVMKYLECLKNNELATKEILFSKFKEDFDKKSKDSLVKEKTYKELLNEYFFKPLEKYRPSFTQLHAFIKNSFSALKTFAASPFVLKANIGFTFGGQGKAFSNKMAEILRTHFVRTIIENSREFVARNVSSESFSEGSVNGKDFGEQLKNFPLLIMRQGEKENDYCYSFIYNDIKKMPKELKIYLLSQKNGDSRKILNLLNIPNKSDELDKEFAQEDITRKGSKDLLEIIKAITGNRDIKEDPNYKITLDNFYKMCLIIQRMRAQLPIVIMGETGVGKTALIRFLVENVYKDDLEIINIHAGIHGKVLIDKVNAFKKKAACISKDKRLWVFFDEFNTSEDVGLISDIILSRRFLGKEIKGNLVFLGACNPFRKKEEVKYSVQAGIQKTKKINKDNQLLYKVLPPPESMIEVMWDYQGLKTTEIKVYIETMLDIKYKRQKVIEVLCMTYQFMQEKIEKSAVSLRDIARFKSLYNWFFQNMPLEASLTASQTGQGTSSNYQIKKEERAFILTLCFCYVMRLPSKTMRDEYIEMVENRMGYIEGHMLEVLSNEQIDYLTRMDLPEGTALNLALRENLFSALVCLLNKIPIIIVGMPGCSKTLAATLLAENLRGSKSREPFFQKFKELSIVKFQGSESCSSEGVEKAFQRAKRNLNIAEIIPVLQFDEIGLAEDSIHNPLKVLHSELEIGRTEVSFIGLSNWELDPAKMNRFLIVYRPTPSETELTETATKIFENILQDSKTKDFKRLIQALSASYDHFINNWRTGLTLNPDFFGLRDFYSLIKFVSRKINKKSIDPNNHKGVAAILKKGIQRNFDGQPNSIEMFFAEVSKRFGYLNIAIDKKEERSDIISLLRKSLNDPDKRSLLLIIRGESLVHMTSKNLKTNGQKIMAIYGSMFEQDRMNEGYNVRVLSEFMNHVQLGNVVVCKDLNNSIQTSLYDIYNKSYYKSGQKNYCRLAIGANSNSRCLVHPDFNSIIYINEAALGEVDPPFLNRFEKHYLTLDRFLTPEDITVLEKLIEWLEKITVTYFEEKGPLQKENFIMNSSLEALTSLCLKNSFYLRSKEALDKTFIEDCFELSKQELLLNATSDFMLWIESSDLKKKNNKEYDFIQECYQKKVQLKLENLSELNSRVIVFTYQQSSYSITLDSPKTTRIIKMIEMKNEKDLKYELQSFCESTSQDLCIIKMDFETDIKHLSLLLFVIENYQQLICDTRKKNYIITLHHSRVAAACSERKITQEISYLNGWTQLFLEDLSFVNKGLPLTIEEVITKKINNSKDIIRHSIQNSMIRFNFKMMDEARDPNYLSKFIQLLLNFLEGINDPQNRAIIEFIRDYFLELLQKASFLNWRKEVLNHKEIATLAFNIEEAIELYAIEKIEDLATFLLKYLLESKILTSIASCFDFKLFENLIPNIDSYLKSKLRNIAPNPEFYTRICDIYKPTKLESLSRAVNSNEIMLSCPRLFPHSERDQQFFYGNDSDNPLSTSLHSIALQLNKVEQEFVRMNQEAKTNDQGGEETEDQGDRNGHQDSQENNTKFDTKEFEANFDSLKGTFNQLFMRMTILTQFDEEDKCILNLLEKLNKKEHNTEKEYYLTDVRNMFIEKMAKADIKTSIFLDKVITLFLNSEYSIEDYLMILFRGEVLWKHLLQIYQIFIYNIEDSSFVDEVLLPEIEIKVSMNIGELFKAQIKYVDSFFKGLAKTLVPTKINFNKIGGSQKYCTIFTNIYFWLIKLQNEFEVSLPFSLVIWKNLAELLQAIFLNNVQEIYDQLDQKLYVFDENFAGALFVIIDDFLEDKKKDLSDEHKRKVSIFQAAVLFKLWIPNYHEILVDRLFLRINEDKDFPNFCSAVIDCIMQKEGGINEIFEELGNLTEIQAEIESRIKQNDFENTFSAIIVDYFDKVVVDESNNTRQDEASLFLEQNFNDFEKYFEVIKDRGANNLQYLAIMGFFKHYIRIYVDCLLEEKNYEILDRIDDKLLQSSYLADALCIFSLKLLRVSKESFKDLKEFLFAVERFRWPSKFKDLFDNSNEKIFFLPMPPQTTSSREMQKKWDELNKSKFENETAFDEIVNLSKAGHQEKYFFLTLFLSNIYASSPQLVAIENLKSLFKKKKGLLESTFIKEQIDLLNCYLEKKIDERFLHISNKTSQQELNLQVLVMNVANWLTCLKDFNSPWTSLFYENGKIPNNFSQYFNSQFMITGLDNPFVTNARAIYQVCRYNGVYICSSECDYIYLIQNCGWPTATSQCPFCKKDIGNAKNRFMHILAREYQGARRIGPPLSYTSSNFCINEAFRKDDKYWNSLEKDILVEIDRIKDKEVIKLYEGEEKTEICMTGYNRFKNKYVSSISRIETTTDYFLRFILHIGLYVLESMKWVKPGEMLKIIKVEDEEALFMYLEDNIRESLDSLQKNLGCNDSIVWILRMEQILAEVIEKSPFATPKISYKHREEFEKKIEEIICYNLGEKKMTIIKDYKKTNNLSFSKLDSILCEELNEGYKFLRILRMTKLPSLNEMKMLHERVIKTNYPLLDECLRHMQEIEEVANLAAIIEFSNEIMRLVNHKKWRDDVRDMTISDFINKLPEKDKELLNKQLNSFLQSWNHLNMGPIHYQCKVLGKMDKYTEKTPLVAFLVDSFDENNVFGKILPGVISALCDKQNSIINKISSRTNNTSHLKNIQLFDNNYYLPEMINSNHILDIQESTVEDVILQTSSCHSQPGAGGIVVYDFDRIQFNLLLRLVGKKMLITNVSLYENVRFIGENFAKQAKFSDYISQVRRLSSSSPISNIQELEEKFKNIEAKSPNHFYSVLKQLQGSLEKLIIFYNNLRWKNISLSEYVKKYKFTEISTYISDEAPIKDYDIGCLVALYEWVEKKRTPTIWRLLPDKYKEKKLSEEEIKAVNTCLLKLKDESQQKRASVVLPSLTEFYTAFLRFVSRCLLLGEFEPEKTLNDWLFIREDLWSYPYQATAIENLQQEFPDITFNKIHSLYEVMEIILNPPQKSVQYSKPIIRENIPIHRNNAKGTKTKVFT